MRKFLLSAILAIVVLGSAALTSAQAQWRRTYYYSYSPGYYTTYYSAPVYSYYTTPGWTSYYYSPPVYTYDYYPGWSSSYYYAPGYYYTPGYYSYYYGPRWRWR